MTEVKLGQGSKYLPELQLYLAQAAGAVLENTSTALAKGAGMIKGAWQERTDSIQKMSTALRQEYKHSIRSEPTGAYEYTVSSDSKAAHMAEEGTPEWDMKKTHPFGRRSRVSKEGVPYLIVPMQWKTPTGANKANAGIKNVMPVNIYERVKRFTGTGKMTTLVGAGESDRVSKNALGELVGRAKYNTGQYRRLDAEGNENGMVRTPDSTGKDRAGGYFTFRVISANSPASSWRQRGIPAQYILEGVLAETVPKIESMLEEALGKDLA